MPIPIQNANTMNLDEAVGTLPNMEDGILNWFQKLTFVQIVKKTVNFQVVETPTNVDFLGVWQPFTAQSLFLKPEGQRNWKWFTCHAEINAPLVPDDVVQYQGTQYRVKEKLDFSSYGYIEYHLIEDYTGAGPTV